MRKKVFGQKLSRNRKSRDLLFRKLTKEMIFRGSVKTTKAKARAVRPELEVLIGFVKQDTLVARRAVLGKLGNDKKAADELFKKYGALAGSRNSGYVRMVSLLPRRGDNAEMAKLEWVEQNENVSDKNKRN